MKSYLTLLSGGIVVATIVGVGLLVRAGFLDASYAEAGISVAIGFIGGTGTGILGKARPV